MTEALSCEKPSLELISSLDNGAQIIDNKLVAKVIASIRYNPWVLKTTLGKMWKMSSGFQVKRGPDRSFILLFENSTEKDGVFDTGHVVRDYNERQGASMVGRLKYSPSLIAKLPFSHNLSGVSISQNTSRISMAESVVGAPSNQAQLENMALGKKSYQEILPKLNISEFKNPVMVDPKPFDMFVHLTSSLFKFGAIVVGPNLKEIREILGITKENPLFSRLDLALRQDENSTIDDGNSSAHIIRSHPTMDEAAIMQVPNTARKWKHVARE
ncbi:hypothetical protein GH714_042319 [Hevea brasiliensis]|uniref:Uncharacterized protein n=1 Tax=Hevea brasiliensis TaxID=3981 RepID=A0A6A6K921_HEVBR|nr:hypothetical protein GH714_042319 [Hevea brasiliensis]